MKLTQKIALLGAFALFGSYQTQAQKDIRATTIYNLVKEKMITKISDINNDGIQDIVVLTTARGPPEQDINMYKGNGDGTYDQKGTHLLRVYNKDLNGVSFELTDIDNDGNTDIIIKTNVRGPPEQDINMYKGNGDGTFDKKGKNLITTYNNNCEDYSNFLVKDMNNDGNKDIIIRTNARGPPEQEIYIYYNKGNATFKKY